MSRSQRFVILFDMISDRILLIIDAIADNAARPSKNYCYRSIWKLLS
ncbi:MULTISPECIES: hypothetical protein [unclassified Microcoleus]